MHTVLTRANALAAYTMSVLAGLTFVCFLSTFFQVKTILGTGKCQSPETRFNLWSGIHPSSGTAFFRADVRPEKSPCNQGKLCQGWKTLKLELLNFNFFQPGQRICTLVTWTFSRPYISSEKAISALVWIPVACLQFAPCSCTLWYAIRLQWCTLNVWILNDWNPNSREFRFQTTFWSFELDKTSSDWFTAIDHVWFWIF